MAVINILPNGVTAGNPNSMGNKNPPKRSKTIGWNYQVSRRLKKWLYSIPVNSLTGHGVAFTFTVRDCPENSDDWAKLRDQLLKRLFRMDCIRLQWLTEWQARGVPHLHGIAYFESMPDPNVIKNHWCELADQYGSATWAQDVKPVTNVLGWLDYLAKHAARSSDHYQRSPENIPQGWEKTGRMWGSRGHWEVREPMRFQIDQDGFYAFRRIAKAIYHANARQRLNAKLRMLKNFGPDVTFDHPKKAMRFFCKSELRHFVNSRSLLKVTDPNMGRMMGTSDWIDQDSSIRIINWLGSQGHRVEQKVDD